MGSPSGPILANIFMCHFEIIWLGNCPSNFKPIVCRRFVDDTFLLFRQKDHVEKRRNYLNKSSRGGFVSVRAVRRGSQSPFWSPWPERCSWDGAVHLFSAPNNLPNSSDYPSCTIHMLSWRNLVSNLEPCDFVGEWAKDCAIQAQLTI